MSQRRNAKKLKKKSLDFISYSNIKGVNNGSQEFSFFQIEKQKVQLLTETPVLKCLLPKCLQILNLSFSSPLSTQISIWTRRWPDFLLPEFFWRSFSPSHSLIKAIKSVGQDTSKDANIDSAFHSAILTRVNNNLWYCQYSTQPKYKLLVSCFLMHLALCTMGAFTLQTLFQGRQGKGHNLAQNPFRKTSRMSISSWCCVSHDCQVPRTAYFVFFFFFPPKATCHVWQHPCELLAWLKTAVDYPPEVKPASVKIVVPSYL